MPNPQAPWPSQRDPDWPLPDRPDHPFYLEVLKRAYEDGDYSLFRECALNDFWFFCRWVLSLGKLRCDDIYSERYGKPWLDHPWLFERCREIQAEPNGCLDLWPRYHFKTSLLTQSLTLWDLADNPDLRFAIITYKMDTVGESFLAQIKNECEDNELLKRLFPATFWANPQKQAKEWTLDALRFKQTGNPKEPSIIIASLRGGITAFHVDVRIFDDIVTEENVRSTDAIDDTTLRVRNISGTASDFTVNRATGTHWAVGDTYDALLKGGIFKLRHHDLFEADGVTPVLRSKQWCEDRYREMTLIGGTTHWVCVMRNKPELASDLHFELSWLEYYDTDPMEMRAKLNVYMIIDTAKAKSKSSDYTVISVVGLGKGVPFGHYYLLDMVRDRLGLTEMGDIVFSMVEKWKPTYVFIETVGAARDDEYLRERQNEELHKFRIISYDDKIAKEKLISQLEPIFKAHRFHFPRKLQSRTEGRPVDLIERFVNDEYRVWSISRPSKYDDVLDNLARVTSPKIGKLMKFPVEQVIPYTERPPDVYRRVERNRWDELDRRARAWAI